MKFIRELVNYLDGDVVEEGFVDRCLKNSASHRGILYRAILCKEGSSSMGQKRKVSRRRICSASECADSARKACASYAHDYEKNTKGKELVVLQIDCPTVCISHKVLLRVIGAYGHLMLNYNLLKQEREVIISGNQYGRVISVRKL